MSDFFQNFYILRIIFANKKEKQKQKQKQKKKKKKKTSTDWPYLAGPSARKTGFVCFFVT